MVNKIVAVAEFANITADADLRGGLSRNERELQNYTPTWQHLLALHEEAANRDAVDVRLLGVVFLCRNNHRALKKLRSQWKFGP